MYITDSESVLHTDVSFSHCRASAGNILSHHGRRHSCQWRPVCQEWKIWGFERGDGGVRGSVGRWRQRKDRGPPGYYSRCRVSMPGEKTSIVSVPRFTLNVSCRTQLDELRLTCGWMGVLCPHQGELYHSLAVCGRFLLPYWCSPQLCTSQGNPLTCYNVRAREAELPVLSLTWLHV